MPQAGHRHHGSDPIRIAIEAMVDRGWRRSLGPAVTTLRTF